jgi:hypothetical protein
MFTRGEVIFESLLPPQEEGGSCPRAVRTLFQLGGDVVVKVSMQVLTRADSQDILEAHMQWTGWCLAQLGQALALPASMGRLGWCCVVAGSLCFLVGNQVYGGWLQPLGILLTMPVYLLLRSPQLRYVSWAPSVLWTLTGILYFTQGGGVSFDIWHMITTVFLTLQLVGGRCMSWAAGKTLPYLIRRKLRQAFT